MNTYVAKKVGDRLGVLDARWAEVPYAELAFVWQDAFPSPYTTTARLVHSTEGLTVRLSTNEWPLRAENTACNGRICDDSCMEFFFTPNEVDREYINIEINPFGLTHIAVGEGRHGRTLLDIEGEGLVIETAIRPREGWAATVFVPYTFIEKHFETHTATLRANFYKCGELTVKEHYSVWNPIDLPKPDYHQPSFFGRIVLSEEEI